MDNKAFKQDLHYQTLKAIALELEKAYGEAASMASQLLGQAVAARTALLISGSTSDARANEMFIEAMNCFDSAAGSLGKQIHKVIGLQQQLASGALEMTQAMPKLDTHS